MSRPTAPLWLALPSRFAGWSRPAAFAMLAVLALALLASLAALRPGEDLAGDPSLYGGVVESLRHGADYYPMLADALRSDGPGIAFAAAPPLALAVILAILPDWGVSALLFALAGGVFTVWWPRLDSALANPAAQVGALLLLGAGLLPYLRPSFLYLPEVWAGLLIALSLGLWSRGRWVEAAAFGVAAGMVRETAAVYPVVMALFAIRSGERREALGWAVALALIASVTAAHWLALAGVTGPLDGPAEPWRAQGIGQALRALVEASPLSLLPVAAAAPLLALTVFGWTSLPSPVGARIAGTFLAALLLICVGPGVDASAGFLMAALMPAGLAFVPDGVRDLLRAAPGARRRITVTRVVP